MNEDIIMSSETNEKSGEIITVEGISSRVYYLRGQQVMLDYDLAEIYGYKVKNLNQQVKRNIARFPEDFMFQLTRDELISVKSQIVISREGISENYLKSQIVTLNEKNSENCLKSQIATLPNHILEGQSGGRRTLPYAFTEQGIYMLATVLRGELAEQQSIFIMRAFREMRHYIRQNQQFATQSEMSLVTAKVSELTVQMAGISDRQSKTEQNMVGIQNSIDILNENFISEKDYKNYVIYKGQKFEADVAYIDIYQQATESIYVVDDYVNAKTLQLLSQKKKGVEIVLFTENGHGRKGFLTASVVNDFKEQYPPLRIKENPNCHDRWIVIDYGLSTECIYHCGASSKDAGRKVCAINKLENAKILRPVVEKLLAGEDKEILE